MKIRCGHAARRDASKCTPAIRRISFPPIGVRSPLNANGLKAALVIVTAGPDIYAVLDFRKTGRWSRAFRHAVFLPGRSPDLRADCAGVDPGSAILRACCWIPSTNPAIWLFQSDCPLGREQHIRSSHPRWCAVCCWPDSQLAPIAWSSHPPLQQNQ